MTVDPTLATLTTMRMTRSEVLDKLSRVRKLFDLFRTAPPGVVYTNPVPMFLDEADILEEMARDNADLKEAADLRLLADELRRYAGSSSRVPNVGH